MNDVFVLIVSVLSLLLGCLLTQNIFLPPSSSFLSLLVTIIRTATAFVVRIHTFLKPIFTTLVNSQPTSFYFHQLNLILFHSHNEQLHTCCDGC